MEKYHTVIIGSGPAGYSAALRIASLDKTVCLIDKSEADLGGACLNRGCIPVKSFLESANLYQKIKLADSFGLKAEIQKPDLGKIKEKSDNNVSLLKKGLLFLLKSKKVDLKLGEASFISSDKIEVKTRKGDEQVEAENFVIATGSKPKKLPNLDVDGRKIFDSDQLCKNLPQAEDILIVGGGYVGCEFAQFYNSLGSKVTIVEVADSLLPGQDKDTAGVLEKEFSKKGIEILTSNKVISDQTEKFDITIVAVGREANVGNLNLARAGVELEQGFVKVDKNFKTTADNIYAVGDLINTQMLAHVALAEGARVADYILGKVAGAIDYNLVPEVVFSQPQVASVGLKQCRAESQKIEIEIKKNFFRANPKAQIAGQISGFSKMIFSKENDKLLGASIVGSEANELIHTLIAFAKKGATKKDIGESIYAHPTLSEIFGRNF